MLHCVIRAVGKSSPFNSLRIVVPENVTEPVDRSDSLLDEEYMKIYEDDKKFEILNEEKRHVRGNGEDYFVAEIASFADIKANENYTEFSVNLKQPVMQQPEQRARGFKIEYISNQYARKLKNTFSYTIEVYNNDTLRSYQSRNVYCTDLDIMEAKYGDLWIVLPKNMVSEKSEPSPTGSIEIGNLAKEAFSEELDREKDWEGREAYRWRIQKKCDINSGKSVGGYYSKPLPLHRYTYLAIVLGVIGILATILIYFVF